MAAWNTPPRYPLLLWQDLAPHRDVRHAVAVASQGLSLSHSG